MRRRRGFSASSCGRCRPTTSSACAPICSAPTTRAPSSPRSGRPGWRRSIRCPRSRDRCAAGAVWLHVDAAYAGSAAICPSSGTTSRAGSAPTRSASTRTSGSACRWTARCSGRRATTTSGNAFSLVPEFLRSPDDAVNLSEVSIPLGRRFRALKLWAVLRCYGRVGPAGAAPRAPPARRALRGLGARRAGLGGRPRRGTSRSSASVGRAPTRTTSACSSA